MFGNHKKTWSPEEENSMLTSLRKGNSVEDISSEHQRSVNAINIRLGMLFNKMIYSGKKTIKDISSKYNLEEGKIKSYINTYIQTYSSDKTKDFPMQKLEMSSSPSINLTLSNIELKIQKLEDHVKLIDEKLKKILKKKSIQTQQK